MITYRLPEALGGGQHEEYRHVSGGTEAPVGTVAFLINGCLVCVAAALLSEVKPPMPPEPPVGAYHIDHQLAVRDASPEIARWYWCQDNGRSGYATWAVVWHHLGGDGVQVVPLVPAPEPVTLPWTGGHDRQDCRVTVYGLSEVVDVNRVGETTVASHWTPNAAREKAYALLTAADEADRRVSDATP